MLLYGVFFFKQKTAYEMLRSLVGSEMCIRDRLVGGHEFGSRQPVNAGVALGRYLECPIDLSADASVSYTHLTLPTIYSV